MRAIILKLAHDFWLNKTKFLLCILAASLSTWGISSAIYSYVLSARDFQENFAGTYPADIVVSVKGANDSLIQLLNTFPGITGVEERSAIAGRIRGYSGSWMPITLFGVKDFNRLMYNRFRLIENKSEEFDGIYIEQNANLFIDGSEENAVVQIDNTDSLILQKTGIIHDPGLAPAQMEQVVYAYTRIANIEGNIKNPEKRLLVKTDFRNPSQLDLNKKALEIKKWFSNQGIVVTSIVIPEWGKHPHQGIVDGISFLQKSFGTVLSMLGIVLLSLILLTWIFPQLPHVGIMKALGASTKKIVWSYLFVLIFILSLGLFVGMPLGWVAAKGYNRFIAMIQNFEVIGAPLPLFYHLIVIISCVTLPLLFSWSSLFEVSRTSVNDAMNKIFYSSGLLFRITQRIIQATKLKYAVNSLWRHGMRTFLLILLLSSGFALFFTGNNLEYSIKKDFSNTLSNIDYPIIISLGKQRIDRFHFLDSMDLLTKVAYVNGEMIQYKSKAKGYDESVLLRTFPPGYIFKDQLVLTGRLDRNCQDCFYINQRMFDDFKSVLLGEKIEFTRRDGSATEYKYSGVIKDPGGTGIYRFADEPLTSFNIVTVGINDKYSPDDALRQLKASFERHGISVRQIATSAAVLVGLENHLAPTYVVIQYMGIFTVVVALMGIMLVLSLAIQERSLEIGIMKSLGCNRAKITGLFQNEFLFLNSLAIATGLILTYFLTNQLCATYGAGLLGIGFPPRFNLAVMGGSILILFAVQYILVMMYCGFKISATTRELISYNG